MFEDGRRPASLLGERRQRARRGRARAGRELRGAVECRHIDVSWIDVVVDVDSEEMVLVEDTCVCGCRVQVSGGGGRADLYV